MNSCLFAARFLPAWQNAATIYWLPNPHVPHSTARTIIIGAIHFTSCGLHFLLCGYFSKNMSESARVQGIHRSLHQVLELQQFFVEVMDGSRLGAVILVSFFAKSLPELRLGIV